jgi:hypothetical protein
MEESSPQNQTALRRPVRQIQIEEEERKERISKAMGWCLISTAAFIDLAEALLTVLAIGLVLNPIISVCADVIFIIWFKILGVSFIKKPKNLAAMGIQALIGIIPGADALPELTVAVFILVKITQSEDRGGLIGKVAGIAS